MTEYPYFPKTGDYDTAEDVVGNLTAILDRSMTVDQKNIIVGGPNSRADELHTHTNVKHADKAGALDNDIIINNTVVRPGINTEVPSPPLPHSHKISSNTANTVLNSDGSAIRSNQMRDIYVGSGIPSGVTPTASPKKGDIYFRII